MAILGQLVEHRWPLLASLVTLWVVRRWLAYRKIRHFRGPWTTAFFDFPHSIKTYYGEGHQWYYDVVKRYGPIARIGPKSLVTSSPDL
ncbi:hypothetical protein VTK26DRAFT_1221 [Humicola hyalothermophila]